MNFLIKVMNTTSQKKDEVQNQVEDVAPEGSICAPLQAKLDLEPKQQKSISDLILKPGAHWVGDGFNVFPVFNRKAFTSSVSPFLMFDYAAPKHFKPTRHQLGVGEHPHRGMETVTIAWQGEVEHGDTLGNHDVIRAGDVQWMTAARGIVHQEYHSREFAKSGGVFEMCQVWVNLPSKHKLDPPRYQAHLQRAIPCVELPSGAGRLRVIAGDFFGVKGPSMTFTPIDLWHVELYKTGGCADLVFPDGHNTMIFVKRGAVALGARKLSGQDMALLGTKGNQASLEAMENATELLILSGEPIDEPIAAQGPFVMNTRAELHQAFDDYSRGRNGFQRKR